MTLHWSFDPILFSIGPLVIHWYGALFMAAFLTGRFLLVRIFAAENVAKEGAERLLFHALIGTIVGARLVHCLAYDPAYYVAHPLAILKIWEGGLASHGGAMGLLIGLWLAARSTSPRIDFLWLLDRASIAAAVGAVFVRVANFLNSEIVGVPTSAAFGVVFQRVDALPRHPVQLYEAAAYLLIAAVLAAVYRYTGARHKPGMMLGMFMLSVFGARIALEAFKTPQAAYEAAQTFTVGQYLSMPFVLFGAVMIMRAYKRNQMGLQSRTR